MHVFLPKDDPNPGARADQLETSRSCHRYAYDWPPGVATCAELPPAKNYHPSYLARTASVYLEIGANLAAMALGGVDDGRTLATLAGCLAALDGHAVRDHLLKARAELAERGPGDPIKTWRDYHALFTLWREPEIVRFYKDDARNLDLAFAWQRIAGVNPMVLARCTRLPDHFPVGEARFARVVPGDTLAAAAAEGRLFLADYALLDGVETGETDGLRKYLSAPLALFVGEKGTGTLRPVAIQCGQAPGPQNPIVTPDEGWRWRAAMQLVQIADATHHEGVAHLGRTHLVMEAVAVAVERQLARSHPLHVLLEPHVDTTLAINHSARTSLIVPGGTVDRCFAPRIDVFCDLVRTALSSYRLDETAPPQDLAARGLDDRNALPTHPYRDDALPLWDAILAFVGDYLALYYRSDADVAADVELQAFVAELGASDGGRLAGVPAADTLEGLRFLLARLIFIAGPQHSALNFPQFAFMGFVPNMPGASYTPPFSDDVYVDEEHYVRMLPPWRTAVEDTSMIYMLSHLRHSRLGDYGDHFADPRVEPVVDAFRSRLDAIEDEIGARDADRLMSYPWLRPSNVLQSISI